MQFERMAARLAARQHGLITQQQADELGLGRSGWYRRLAGGRLVQMAPGVAALPGAVSTPEQRILAAVLAAGPGAAAMASHRSAAHLWGVAGLDHLPVDLTFAERTRSLTLAGVVAHHPTDVVDLRPVVRDGIPATNPLRVLVDLGQVAPAAVPAALQTFLADGLVSRAAVLAALRRHARPGRHGVTALRQALTDWAIGDRPPDSLLELRMTELLRSHALPAAEFHQRVLGYEVDFVISIARLIVECDGWDAHGRDREQFERDRARDAALVAAGWLVLRFTWLQITRRPDWVAAMVREAVRSRCAGPAARGDRSGPRRAALSSWPA